MPISVYVTEGSYNADYRLTYQFNDSKTSDKRYTYMTKRRMM
jgi:hypothetical protein